MDQPAWRPGSRSGRYFITATASFAEERPRTLKAGDTFAVFGHDGDATDGPDSAEGVYYRDTRYLSRVTLTVDGAQPILLSSAVSTDNALLTCDLTNPDLIGATTALEHDQLHIRRAKFLWSSTCYERLTVRNFSMSGQRVALEIGFAADFADVFEVRGARRARRGRMFEPRLEGDLAVLAYEGLDGVRRATALRFDPAPVRLDADRAYYEFALEPEKAFVVGLEIHCIEGATESPPRPGFMEAMRAARQDRRRAYRQSAIVETDNDIFDEAMRRAAADLVMLVTDTEQGP